MRRKSLYTALKEAGCEMDNWQSDLYIRANDFRAREILRQYRTESANPTSFTSQIDGCQWIDIPFAYDPYWHARQS